MDVSEYQHTDSIVIDRPPEDVYAIVSDVTRIGEQSPICKAATWDDPSQAGKEFAFINCGPDGDRQLVRWGYVFEPAGDGTKVTESWELLPEYPEFIKAVAPDADLTARLEVGRERAHAGIPETLANLKKLAEG